MKKFLVYRGYCILQELPIKSYQPPPPFYSIKNEQSSPQMGREFLTSYSPESQLGIIAHKNNVGCFLFSQPKRAAHEVAPHLMKVAVIGKIIT